MVDDNPFVKPITDIHYVQPRAATKDGGRIIVLDVIEPGVVPDYCVHGKVSCWYCDDWCWLGDKSYDVVVSGDVAPMCRPCAIKLVPKDSKPIGNIGDHRE